MLKATENPANASQNIEPDRFARATFFANELSESILRETEAIYKNRWTDVRRAQKAAIAHLYKPWEHATGPKTPEGKLKSSLNACGLKSLDEQWIPRFLTLQSAYVRTLRRLRKKEWLKTAPHIIRQRMMTLEEIMRDMRDVLTAAGVETPALDARLLARQGGNFSDIDLISKSQSPLPVQAIENIQKLLARRLKGEPVSRIAGEREFWGLTFKISPDTLDPRPDTETLVEQALKRANSLLSLRAQRSNPSCDEGLPAAGWIAASAAPPRNDDRQKPLRILDLGTGSGCILLSLLHELPNATGVGTDLNPGAVAISRENAASLGLESRAEFRTGSWFEPLDAGESFDLIVSNPPYIPESDIESLAIDVRHFDPILALTGGVDGLDPYKIILQDIKKHLGCGGFALFEIGKGQEKDLARLVEDSNMTLCDSYADLAGTLRVIEITYGDN